MTPPKRHPEDNSRTGSKSECAPCRRPSKTHRRRTDAGHPGAESGGGKKVVGPIARREAVGRLRAQGTSLRRACRVIGLSTSTWRYERQVGPINTQLLARLTVHASARPRFGYRRLHTLVDREGLHVNHKRLYGVYREAKLQGSKIEDFAEELGRLLGTAEAKAKGWLYLLCAID